MDVPAEYVAGTTKLTAVWRANEANVVFKANYPGTPDAGQNLPGDEVAKYTGTTDATLSGSIPNNFDGDGFELKVGARTYAFGGWYQLGNGYDSQTGTFSGQPLSALPATYPANNTEYYARWIDNSMGTINFVSNGGSDIESVTLDLEHDFSATPDDDVQLLMTSGSWNNNPVYNPRYLPTRFGYEFIGWYLNQNLANTAQNGGAPTRASQDKLPDTPFYNDATDSYDIKTLTYYAAWKAMPAAIAFDMGDVVGAYETPSMITGVTDQDVTTCLDEDGAEYGTRDMPEVSVTGYSFAYWTDADGGIVSSLPEKMPYSSTMGDVYGDDIAVTTYTAHWTPAEATISFVGNGGTKPDTLVGKTGEELGERRAIPEAVYDGYTFGGWYKNSPTFDDSALVTDKNDDGYYLLPERFEAGDNTYYAKWTANPVNITFDYNVSGIDGLENVVWHGWTDLQLPYTGNDYDGEACDFSELPAPADGIYPGYTFEGWYTYDGVLLENVEGIGNDGKFPMEDTAYVAFWSANGNSSYIFATNGGSAVTTRTGVAGTDVPADERLVKDPTRDGYAFDGWFTNPYFSESSKVAKVDDGSGNQVYMLPERFDSRNITWYAKWTASPAFFDWHANYDGYNSPVGDTDVVERWSEDATGATAVTGSAVNPDAKQPTVARDGYTSAGWYTAPDGGELVATPTKYLPNTTNYDAHWTANDSTLKFVTNGGTSVNDVPGKSGKRVVNRTLPTTTQDGYTFIGWFESQDDADAATTQVRAAVNSGTSLSNAINNVTTKLIQLPEFFPAKVAPNETEFFAAWHAQNASVTFDYGYDGQNMTRNSVTGAKLIGDAAGSQFTQGLIRQPVQRVGHGPFRLHVRRLVRQPWTGQIRKA